MSSEVADSKNEVARELTSFCRAGGLYDVERQITAGNSLDVVSAAKGRRQPTLLQIAVETGCHRLVELIAKHEDSQPSKNAALADAAAARRLDPECYTSAIEEACRSETTEVLTRLKPDSSRDNLSELLHRAAVWPRKAVVEYLLETGANPNDKPNGGSSALDAALRNLSFAGFNLYRSNKLNPKYDVSRTLDCVRELLRHDALQKPDDTYDLTSFRRSLLECEPALPRDRTKQLPIALGGASVLACVQLEQPIHDWPASFSRNILGRRRVLDCAARSGRLAAWELSRSSSTLAAHLLTKVQPANKAQMADMVKQMAAHHRFGACC